MEFKTEKTERTVYYVKMTAEEVFERYNGVVPSPRRMADDFIYEYRQGLFIVRSRTRTHRNRDGEVEIELQIETVPHKDLKNGAQGDHHKQQNQKGGTGNGARI